MRTRLAVLLAMVLLMVTSVAISGSVCEVLSSSDGSRVFASGRVEDLRISYDAFANFDVVDAVCRIHVYWNFDGSTPDWLRNGAPVYVDGIFWRSHDKHSWEPEIEATAVAPQGSSSVPETLYIEPSPWTVTTWGAAGEVAGSCYQIVTGGTNMLVDCGSFMNTGDMPSSERGETNDCDPFPFSPRAVSDLIITHAHDDHLGRIHYLIAQGFSGDIHMTAATAAIYREKLVDIIQYCCLPAGQATSVGVAILASIVEHDYLEPFAVTDDVTAVFIDAGHIPGSASVTLGINTDYGSNNLTFSGDIGSGHHPFLGPPDIDSAADTRSSTLFIESTYGASEPRIYAKDLYAEFYKVVQDRLDAGQLIIIPAWALDRTQTVLAVLLNGAREGRLSLDKPIGVGGKSSYYFTELYIEMQQDPEMWGRYLAEEFCREEPFSGNWEFVRTYATNSARETPDQAWNYDVVVTPSGTGSSSYSAELINAFSGDPRVAFIQVGWTPIWTSLGRLSQSKQLYNVHDVFSGHADNNGILAYISSFGDLERVIITHGDDGIGAREGLVNEIRSRFPHLEIVMATYGKEIPL